MLSASILDYMIHKEHKFSADYNTAENNIEMQVRAYYQEFITCIENYLVSVCGTG